MRLLYITIAKICVLFLIFINSQFASAADDWNTRKQCAVKCIYLFTNDLENENVYQKGQLNPDFIAQACHGKLDRNPDGFIDNDLMKEFDGCVGSTILENEISDLDKRLTFGRLFGFSFDNCTKECRKKEPCVSPGWPQQDCYQ